MHSHNLHNNGICCYGYKALLNFTIVFQQTDHIKINALQQVTEAQF